MPIHYSGILRDFRFDHETLELARRRF
jgi:hypothetical protein